MTATEKTPRILVLGAGFGGLELTTLLSEALGDRVDVTLIDKSDTFVFGFFKLDVMFWHKQPDAVRMPYAHYAKPGVRLLRRTITHIDPEMRRVTTDDGVFDADILVVALGAEYDFDATPGLAGTNEFYSVPGAERLRDILPTFTRGRALIGVCGAPFKCPPAPNECALMLHDYLVSRGVRDACEIDLVLPQGGGRFLLWPDPYRQIPRALAGASRGQGYFRLQPPCPLVRPLIKADAGRAIHPVFVIGAEASRASISSESRLASGESGRA